jgi:tetratricopeptide (TPR) repeat protein
MSQGNFDGAIKDCSELIKLAPNFTRAFYLCGDAYTRKGLLDEALKNYTEVIKLNAHNARAYIARGKVHAAKGSRELAISDFKKVFEITGDPQLRQEAQQQLNLLGVK